MSLDPDDWEALRRLGHRMIDRMIDRHRTIAGERVHRQPGHHKKRLQRPVPEQGAGFEAAYQDYLDLVEPFGTGNLHPRFFGWALGSGTSFGALAQLLTGALSANAFGGEQAATYVETELLGWLKTILRQPPEACGLLTSGASIANLYALHVARETLGRRRVVASDQVHVSIDRACRMLGLELTAAADPAAAIDAETLAVVGTAGTVVTGAFEDLDRLAQAAADKGAWFHVDAAIGIGAALTPRLQDSLRGLERADSVAFDLHKWLQIGPGTGGLLVRNARAHAAAFRQPSPYLGAIRGGLGGSDVWFHRLGAEHTRRFLALEPWLVLLAYGTERLRAMVEESLDLAQRFAARVDATPDLERLAEVPLNIVLFRFRSEAPRANERLLAELQQRGRAVLSPASLGDRFALRAAIFGHRTTAAQIDAAVDEIADLGRTLNSA